MRLHAAKVGTLCVMRLVDNLSAAWVLLKSDSCRWCHADMAAQGHKAIRKDQKERPTWEHGCQLA